jgi:hypothetical protein
MELNQRRYLDHVNDFYQAAPTIGAFDATQELLRSALAAYLRTGRTLR